MLDKTKLKHDRPDSDRDVSARPSKRPRLIPTPIRHRLPGPDGFSSPEPKPKPKVAYKPPADMSFKSVFETGTSSTTADPNSKKSLTSGRGRTTRLVLPGDTFATAAGKLIGTPEREVSAVSGGSSKAKKRALMRPLKPPVFSASTPPRLHQNHHRQTSTEPTFKRMVPPAFPGLDASTSTSKAQPESSKPPKPLRPPPPPIPPSHKPEPELKPLPPPLPLPSASTSKKGKEKETSQSHLRTISTTHIALSTDLTSQVGSATLLSIFLQQEQGKGNKLDVARGSVFGVGEREEKEVRRGVGVSPVKGGGKGRGFVRNGLAERASNLLSRSQTAFTLWHKETSSQFSSATTARRPTADLHLRILKILHEPPPSTHSRPTPTAHPIIALCRVLNKPQNSRNEAGLAESDIYPILFSSLSPISSNLNPAAREDIKMDKDVYVWKPWYTVELPEPGILVDVSYEEGLDMQLGDEWGLGRSRRNRRSREALLCSRFFVAVS
ncbi:hypothetical protein PILCRDRAFT_825380 [Piloderma croceum F 1598]|uniref:Uncharacterized protein n=1 Tax=Piloderma croceum (strain F 1598) TaxID=765440 RepID=A0A0C3BJ59_PILCF|nr:hypothetical protein PILCRDRAFT_825380 [Piloderma croceum F 1598]